MCLEDTHAGGHCIDWRLKHFSKKPKILDIFGQTEYVTLDGHSNYFSFIIYIEVVSSKGFYRIKSYTFLALITHRENTAHLPLELEVIRN